MPAKTAQTFTRTLTTEITISDVPTCEQAVHVECMTEHPDGSVDTDEYILRRGALDTAIESGDVVTFLSQRPSWDDPNPLLARYDLIQRAMLDLPFMEIYDMLVYSAEQQAPLSVRSEDPAYVPVHLTSDHGLLLIDGSELNVPVEMELWGRYLDVDAIDAHVKGDPRVISYEVRLNTCGQNHGISGRYLGHLTVLLTEADREQLKAIDPQRALTPGRIGELVGRLDYDGAGDVLDIKQFERDLGDVDDDNGSW